MAQARLEVLLADSAEKGSAQSCSHYLSVGYDEATFYSHIKEVNAKVMVMTRAEVRDIYRAIHIAPEAELLAMDLEESDFPAQAVIYLRSVNDETGKVEGIMRLVSGRETGKHYFNNLFSHRSAGHSASPLPIYQKYSDPLSRRFLKENFPNSFEMGRVVFAKGVNEFRVLIDLGTLATLLMSTSDPNRQGSLIVEAVPQAQHRYENLGLRVIPSPIPIKEGRVLMAATVRDLYDRYLGRARKAKLKFDSAHPLDEKTRSAARDEIDAAIQAFSQSSALNRFYAYGLFLRAQMAYDQRDYITMLKDARELLRRNPDVPNYLVLLLAAEVGSRFDILTGEGDAAAALAFLAQSTVQEQFADERLPQDGSHPGLIDFYRGLIHLSSGNYSAAATAQRQISLHPQLVQGRRVPLEILGEAEVDTLRRHWFDPENFDALQVDRDLIRIGLRTQMLSFPLGLTSAYHEYAAHAHRALGFDAEAAKHADMASALRIKTE